MSPRRTGTLEGKVCQMSLTLLLHRRRQSLNALVFLKVHRVGSPQFPGEIQTHLLPVHSDDLVDAHGSQNGNADKADGAAALYHNPAVKAQDPRALGPLHRMDQHRAGLNENPGVQVQITYIEHSGAAPDKDIIGKPSIQMDIVVGKKPVHIGSPYVLLVQVEHGNVRVVLKNHTGDYFVSQFQALSRAVRLHVLSHLHDLAGALMSQGHRDQAEGIPLELVGVRTADAASFHFYQDVIISHRGHGVLFHLKTLQAGENRHMGRLGNAAPCLGCIPAGSRSARHIGKHLFHYLFYLCRISHFSAPPFLCRSL